MIKLRDFRAEDRNMILDTFLKSYYFNMTGKKPATKAYFSSHAKILENLYETNQIVVLIACLDEDEDIILGYSIWGLDKTLHYVYVKESYQRMGIASKMLKLMLKDRSEIVVSHFTKDIKHFQGKYKLTYNPYKFFQ